MVSANGVRKKIPQLDDSKATHWGDVPAKILEQSIDMYLVELTIIINWYFQSECFPKELKMTVVIPIFKKEGQFR